MLSSRSGRSEFPAFETMRANSLAPRNIVTYSGGTPPQLSLMYRGTSNTGPFGEAKANGLLRLAWSPGIGLSVYFSRKFWNVQPPYPSWTLPGPANGG